MFGHRLSMYTALALLSLVLGWQVAATARTVDLHLVVVCPDPDIFGGTLCAPAGKPNDGYADEEELEQGLMRRVAEMNLEYRPIQLSFRPRITLVLEDDMYYSALTGPSDSGPSKIDPSLDNGDILADLRAEYAQAEPEALTLMLVPNVSKCWAGPPPKPPYAMHGVICTPLARGQVYAHEVGHFLCLRHTMTFQDAATHGTVDRNLDDGGALFQDLSIGWFYGYYAFEIYDTPGDPGPQEDSDVDEDTGAPLPLHEWCEPIVHDGSNADPDPVDPGSPHASWCEIECFQTDLFGNVFPSSLQPRVENAMSYYGGRCQGPYVKGGVRHEGFSEDQYDKMLECLSEFQERKDLADPCKGKGGDLDLDGWCNAEDVCHTVANTLIVDTDNDGTPDPCDACPNTPDDQTDTDGDGAGDACDNDDDNDGCTDSQDDEPKNSLYASGTYISVLCNLSDKNVYSFAGDDPDGDGIPSCQDPDNDNDGIPDAKDSCPATPSQFCFEPAVCPGNPWYWWAICMFGGCNELDIRFTSVINPADSVVFEHVRVVNDGVYISPAPGQALSEVASKMLGGGALPTAFSVKKASTEGKGLRRVELLDGATGKVVADLGTFDPALLELGELRYGSVMHFRAPSAQEYCLPGTGECTYVPKGSLGATWAIGLPADRADAFTSAHDKDEDGVPNHADTCRGAFNPMQWDRDGDHIGDLCDADLDGDSEVTSADMELAQKCAAISPAEPAEHTAGVDDTEEPSFEAPLSELSAWHERCQAADMDGDGKIGKIDMALLELAMAEAKDPSGIASPPPQSCCVGSWNNECVIPGDVDGQGGASVVDVQCLILGNLASLAGAGKPTCMKLLTSHADVDCNGQLAVGDVVMTIGRVLGMPLSPALDSNQDACPDSCQL